MKSTRLFILAAFTLTLSLFSSFTVAIEFIDVKVPTPLKAAYQARFSDPNSCVRAISEYKSKKRVLKTTAEIVNKERKTKLRYSFTTQLQAFCYAQIADYANAFSLLSPKLQNPSLSNDEITTLNLIASQIPEQERPQLSNATLLNMLSTSVAGIEQSTLRSSPNLIIKLLFTISELSLQNKSYSDALSALEKAKVLIKEKQNTQLDAWLAYYYGLYYDHINQQQLAISAFMTANQLAEKHELIELSGQVKKNIARMYQEKYRFPAAIEFAKQRVELYLTTKNTIKQTESLIQFAILKRQNGEANNALIYLFNALELIENNKYSALLAHTYLEIGRTHLDLGRAYIDNKAEKKANKELKLAQKYLHNARFHFTRLSKPRYQIESLLLLAELNIIKKDSAIAILQLEKVLQLSNNKYLTLRVQAFEMLALSYEMTGNLQQAILHFKNFHSLQNRIKEHLFGLQQLQISEQLQLFEKTQQQKQLESQNRQLQKTNKRYTMLTYSAILLLILTAILYFYASTRNTKLKEENQRSQHRLAFHSRTKLPRQRSDSKKFTYNYQEQPLYYALVNIPFLSMLNELAGISGSQEIEEKFGKAIKKYFTNSVDIFQLRDSQLLFISRQDEHKGAEDLAQKIQLFITFFAEQHQLPNHISCGIVAFPFLNNTSRAINADRTLNLSSLALFAASQIQTQKQQSSWVELYAIDNLQPAFFDGDLWVLGQAAIDKGLIKINSSHSEQVINWPKLDK